MKKIFAFICVLTLLFSVLSVKSNKDYIVIASPCDQTRNDELQRQLNEKFPDKNIAVVFMSTGKLAAKAYAEGSDSEVDIIVALETGYLNKLTDKLEDISGVSKIEYLDGLTPKDNQNKWVTWERFAGSIIVNTKILEKYGLEAPKTYEDLLKPEYKGLIAMPDPKSSGTGYFFYKNWVNEMGEEKALEYVDKLHNNIKQFTESGSGPIKMLVQGEVAIGLALTFQAVNSINDGNPLEIYFPTTGSPYSLSGTAIMDGHADKNGVSEVFDFIVNDFLIYDKENFSPEAIYKEQINNVENYPTNINYADMKDISNQQEKERLLKLWKY